jgi:hypothetical protein
MLAGLEMRIRAENEGENEREVTLVVWFLLVGT